MKSVTDGGVGTYRPASVLQTLLQQFNFQCLAVHHPLQSHNPGLPFLEHVASCTSSSRAPTSNLPTRIRIPAPHIVSFAGPIERHHTILVSD
jgi:hypothetical protein